MTAITARADIPGFAITDATLQDPGSAIISGTIKCPPGGVTFHVFATVQQPRHVSAAGFGDIGGGEQTWSVATQPFSESGPLRNGRSFVNANANVTDASGNLTIAEGHAGALLNLH